MFQKSEYLKKQNSILDEMKRLYYNFSKSFFGEL